MTFFIDAQYRLWLEGKLGVLNHNMYASVI